MLSPMDKLGDALRQNTLVRIIEQFGEEHADSHLKDLVIDEAGPGREIVVLGRRVINFGSDSFLGLDQDPRVQEAIRNWASESGEATTARREPLPVCAPISMPRRDSPAGWASSRR